MKGLDKSKTSKIINIWLYALGVMGINLGIGLVNSFQAEFFNKILGADLMIIAVIILCAKFVSIVADFVIGNLIDRSNFKSGKNAPLHTFFRISFGGIKYVLFRLYSF